MRHQPVVVGLLFRPDLRAPKRSGESRFFYVCAILSEMQRIMGAFPSGGIRFQSPVGAREIDILEVSYEVVC